ncbi:MAG: SGNH/GDSL hydrolase family protein [Planctomycetota bacterium]
MSTRSRTIWLLEAPLVLALCAVWGGRVVQAHGQPGGVTIEWLCFGALLIPAHLARLCAARGLVPAPGRALEALELLALLALAAGWTAPALALGAALCLALAAPAGGGQAAPAPRALVALGWLSLLALAVSLGLALRWERPLVGTRALLALPLLLEAARGPRSAQAWLRRHTAAAAVAFFAVSRLEVVLGLVAGGWTAGVALWAWRGGARRAAFQLLAPVVVLGALYLAAELLYRVAPSSLGRPSLALPTHDSDAMHRPHAESTWTPPAQPGAPAAAPVKVQWNAAGWHDVEHAREKAAGVLRVLVLGDSFVEGQQVSTDELFHRRLEAALRERLGRPVEAIALGWSGWGQRDQLQALVRQGLAYAPDLVLGEFLPANDVRDNDPELKRAAERELVRSSWARPVQLDAARKGLYLLERLAGRLDGALRKLGGETGWLDDLVYEEHPHRLAADWQAAWQRTEELFVQLDAAARQGGARFAVVIFPSIFEANGVAEAGPDRTPDRSYPARRVAARCAAAKIPCLDLTPSFAAAGDAAARSALYWPGDLHWKAAGHALAAGATAEWLCAPAGLIARRE